MDKEPSPDPPEPEAKSSDSASSPQAHSASSGQAGFSAFWAELKRRKVMRVAVTYAVVAWLIIQVAVNTFPSLLIPGWALSFVVMCVVLGFPVALVLAWAFELTPDGIKKNKAARQENVGTEESDAQSKKRNWLAIGFAAALPTFIFGSLALVFYIRSGGGAEAFEGDKSIAVLPFDNRSNIEEDEFFTNGIHDDLLTQISRIRDIRTLARTSVMGYRDTTKRMKVIGDELGVRWLLEGGVQRGGDQIRINVQLIDSTNEGHLWAETYTRDLSADNIFHIQSEIATSIANSLKAVLSPEEVEQLNKLPTQNLAALEAYYKSLESKSGGVAGYERSLEYLEQAVLLDPNFALAHAELGSVQLQLISRMGLSREQQYAKAEPHILRALEIDHTIIEGYGALMDLRRRQSRFDEAIAAAKESLKWNPNDAEAYAQIGSMNINYVGDANESAEYYRKAYELDPLNSQSRQWLGHSLIYSGGKGEALELGKKEVAENPDIADGYMRLANLYDDYFGLYDESIIAFHKKLALDPRARATLHWLEGCYIDLGDVESAVWWNKRAIEASPDNHIYIAYRTVIISKFLGDEDRSKRALIEGSKRDPNHPWLIGFLTDMDLESGNYEDARSRLQEAYPNLFIPSTEIMAYQIDEALAVARVFKSVGQSDRADDLARRVIRRLEQGRQGHHSEKQKAVAFSIIGDESKVLSTVSKYFEEGGSPYRLEMEDSLKPYFDHPEYIALADKRKAELAIQLERIRRMEANGELAPLPEHLRDR